MELNKIKPAEGAKLCLLYLVACLVVGKCCVADLLKKGGVLVMLIS